MRRNDEMDEYDFLHWRRSVEEREALIRDISWYCPRCSYIFLLYVRNLQSFRFWVLPHCGYIQYQMCFSDLTLMKFLVLFTLNWGVNCPKVFNYIVRL